MATEICIETLSGDRKYERSIKLDRRKIKSVVELEKILSAELRLPVERFDIVKMAEALVYENQHPLTANTDLGNPLRIVVHPETRPVYGHLVTSAKDMIMDFEEDDRTYMSCGHAIVPDNLYDLCWNSLKDGAVQFQCSAIDTFNVRGKQTTCDAIWTLYELTVKAQLSTDERVLFEMRLSKNSLQKRKDVQECPFCRCLSARASENNNRVVCINCQQTNPDNSEFCWQCLHPWKVSANGDFCGNLECTTAKGALMSQEILRTCAKKTIDQYKNVPAVRACPGCHALVEHERGCKRMPCKCKHEFCFVCLKPWSSTGCGYNKACASIATCQEISQ
ncbi:potential E3 ubiquitin-protein ligase ariadne-2-like [Mizuhopecten yessoensis]|uniref:RBR-type E3 ubiquitin transferase n=1 Tax=Mizuhopecten yessoensis TaxID=6573 RepID=A0A210PQQ8_MIZYE|nr:potential E3 ubiquitin-protein ligase ariadne-2-like [Mizuhopecten yessoensis]OWF38825.1 Protein ariadne-2 [Mizuhopecten yessoensis]